MILLLTNTETGESMGFLTARAFKKHVMESVYPFNSREEFLESKDEEIVNFIDNFSRTTDWEKIIWLFNAVADAYNYEVKMIRTFK